MKKCPHCDGDLMDSVVRCVHCGRDLTGTENEGPPPEPMPGVPPPPVIGTAARAQPTPDPPATGTGPGPAGAPPAASAPPPTAPGSPPPIPSASGPPSAVAHGAPTTAQPVSQTPQEPYFVMKTELGSPGAPPGTAGPPPAARKQYVGSKRNPAGAVAGILVLIGGALALAGAFLPWVVGAIDVAQLGKQLQKMVAAMPVAVEVSATSKPLGWLIVISGGVLVLLGLISFVGDRDQGVRRLRLAAAQLPFLGGVSAYLFLSYRNSMSDLEMLSSVLLTIPDTQAQKLAQALSVRWGIGLWLTIAACVAILAGAVAAFAAGGPKVTAIAPGGTNWTPYQMPPPPGGMPRSG